MFCCAVFSVLSPARHVETAAHQVHDSEYAVRGAVLVKATEVAAKLADPAQAANLSFQRLIRCNIGNPHAVQQAPITFFRQVMLDTPDTLHGLCPRCVLLPGVMGDLSCLHRWLRQFSIHPLWIWTLRCCHRTPAGGPGSTFRPCQVCACTYACVRTPPPPRTLREQRPYQDNSRQPPHIGG